MCRDVLDKSNNNRSDRNPRSGHDDRSACSGRSEEEKFLHGEGRFKRQSECADSISTSSGDDVISVSKNQGNSTERRSGDDRRYGRDRRCGFDTRSDVEQFLQGERRSGVDRRSRLERRYRTFKKARAFVRGLGLKSESEWCDYIKSDMRPDDIPVAPHHIYANDGWAGWNDWLATSPIATYLSRYRTFEKARDFAHQLGLVSKSESRAYCGPAIKPDDIPTDSEN